MPFDARIQADRRLGVVTLEGEVDGPAFLGAMRALYEAPAWVPGFSALWDARRLRSLVLEPEDVRAIGALTVAYAPRMGKGRAAFVVPHDMHRMIAVLLIRQGQDPDRERRVFEEMEPALEWLGVEGAVPGGA